MNKMTHDRYIDIGFHCLLNEEKNVRGWAKSMLYFCKTVYALIDPTTTDKTEEILRTEFPQIHIEYQDRALGDSDYKHRGPTGALIFQNNLTHFIETRIKEGEWIFLLAGDERFHPDDLKQINVMIKKAIKEGRDGIIFTQMFTLINQTQYVDFTPIARITQEKFFKKPSSWIMGPQPHSGRNWFPKNGIYTNLALYHYPDLDKINNSWAYRGQRNSYDQLMQKLGYIPLKECPLLIPFWTVYPALDNNGNFINND